MEYWVSMRMSSPGGNFLGWRCIQCGEILGEVILENRQVGTGFNFYKSQKLVYSPPFSLIELTLMSLRCL
jgi:hypothetical protein